VITWQQVVESPRFKQLGEPEKRKVQQKFFEQYVAPAALEQGYDIEQVGKQFNERATSLWFTPEPAQVEVNNAFEPADQVDTSPQAPSRTWGQSVSDLARDMTAGTLEMGAGVVGLTRRGLASREDRMLRGLREEFGTTTPLTTSSLTQSKPGAVEAAMSGTAEVIRDDQSDKRKWQRQQVQDAEGAMDAVSFLLKNPTALLSLTAESLPSMLAAGSVGGALGRMGLAAGASEVAATNLARIGAMVGEGALTAGTLGNDIEGLLNKQGITDPALRKQAMDIANTTGVVTGYLGRIGAGVEIMPFMRESVKESLMKAIPKSMAKEAAEEFVQSYQEAVAKNLALGQAGATDETGKPITNLTQGAMKDASIGALAGAATGGMMPAVSRGIDRFSAPKPPEREPEPPSASTVPLTGNLKADLEAINNAPITPIDGMAALKTALNAAPLREDANAIVGQPGTSNGAGARLSSMDNRAMAGNVGAGNAATQAAALGIEGGPLQTAATTPQGATAQAPASAMAGAPQTERRADLAQRKRISDLTLDEARRELLTSPVTGIANFRAFSEDQDLTPAPVTGYADGDNFKQVNSILGHDEADKVLRAMADIFRQAADKTGAKAYHRSGDEFLFRFDSPSQADAFQKAAYEIAGDKVLVVTDPQGNQYEYSNIGFSIGIAGDQKRAERDAELVKQQRLESGARAGSGEAPVGLSRVTPEGLESVRVERPQDGQDNAVVGGQNVAKRTDERGPIDEARPQAGSSPVLEGGAIGAIDGEREAARGANKQSVESGSGQTLNPQYKDLTKKDGSIREFASKKAAELYLRGNKSTTKGYEPRKDGSAWVLSKPAKERSAKQKAADAPQSATDQAPADAGVSGANGKVGSMEFDNAAGRFNPDLDSYHIKQFLKRNLEGMSDAEINNAAAEYANQFRVDDLLVSKLGFKRRGSSNVSESSYFEKYLEDDDKTYEVRVSDHEDRHSPDGTVEQRIQVNFRSGSEAWADADVTPDLSNNEALERLREVIPKEALPNQRQAPLSEGLGTSGAPITPESSNTPETRADAGVSVSGSVKDIPLNFMRRIMVDVQMFDEQAGRVVTQSVPAKEALTDIDKEIEAYEALKECVG
jgi:GGDEF domain-containing protein